MATLEKARKGQVSVPLTISPYLALAFMVRLDAILRDRALPLPSHRMSPAAHFLLNMNRLDRTAVSVDTFEDQRREDYEYWMSGRRGSAFWASKN